MGIVRLMRSQGLQPRYLLGAGEGGQEAGGVWMWA